jgi:2-dehydro-3-deoxygluconokinase
LFGERDAGACARRLHGLGVAEIAIKTGREGCVVSIAGTTTAVPAQRVLAPVDTTAAGDAFNASYLAARLADNDVIAAARAGNALAGIVIMHPGAIIPRSAIS